MHPLYQIALLLIAIVVLSSLGMASHFWQDGPRTTAVLLGAPCLAGAACGQVMRIVRKLAP
jgi:uncharacterized membrane protein YfcA